MRRVPHLVCTALWATSLLGCGGGEDSSTPHSGPLGQGSVPVPAATPDPGILADATQYQPAKPPVGGATPAGPGRGAGSGPDTGAEELITFVVNAIRDLDAELALRAFEPEHVAILAKDKLDPLFATLELADEIAEELDPTVVDRVLGGLRGAATPPRVDTLDAQNASAAPNVARVLLGPRAGGDALKLRRGPAGWKIQLDAPLTAADADAIANFHQTLQAALNTILDWVRATQPVDEARLKAAAEAAVRGEPVDLPASGGRNADTGSPGPPRDEEHRP